MSIRKIVMLNNNNTVVIALSFDDSDIFDEAVVAGLLSDPECFEVNPNSEVSMGWTYVNGVEHRPAKLEGNL
jgi:hypothetical protein